MIAVETLLRYRHVLAIAYNHCDAEDVVRAHEIPTVYRREIAVCPKLPATSASVRQGTVDLERVDRCEFLLRSHFGLILSELASGIISALSRLYHWPCLSTARFRWVKLTLAVDRKRGRSGSVWLVSRSTSISYRAQDKVTDIYTRKSRFSQPESATTISKRGQEQANSAGGRRKRPTRCQP
jgi:hypothetical protein